ncbi:hypothetical protein Poly51_27090 [Rubripirellula tenax]|uniref:Uncharacterized protein n=1 Tax=Rubripirellula tenax TaxID=2528015 RepID=A0A5C6F749_9BACT|nr:hypothetical protein Poly51_27090 [Rubripirellula tenax]
MQNDWNHSLFAEQFALNANALATEWLYCGVSVDRDTQTRKWFRFYENRKSTILKTEAIAGAR